MSKYLVLQTSHQMDRIISSSQQLKLLGFLVNLLQTILYFKCLNYEKLKVGI